MAQNDLSGALKSFERGLTVVDRLAKSHPSNTSWQRDLAVSYNLVGNVLLTQHALPDALKSYRAALEIVQRLVVSEPNNRQWQNDLQFCIGRIGIAAWSAVLAHDFATALDAADRPPHSPLRQHGFMRAGPMR